MREAGKTRPPGGLGLSSAHARFPACLQEPSPSPRVRGGFWDNARGGLFLLPSFLHAEPAATSARSTSTWPGAPLAGRGLAPSPRRELCHDAHGAQIARGDGGSRQGHRPAAAACPGVGGPRDMHPVPPHPHLSLCWWRLPGETCTVPTCLGAWGGLGHLARSYGGAVLRLTPVPAVSSSDRLHSLPRGQAAECGSAPPPGSLPASAPLPGRSS